METGTPEHTGPCSAAPQVAPYRAFPSGTVLRGATFLAPLTELRKVACVSALWPTCRVEQAAHGQPCQASHPKLSHHQEGAPEANYADTTAHPGSADLRPDGLPSESHTLSSLAALSRLQEWAPRAHLASLLGRLFMAVHLHWLGALCRPGTRLCVNVYTRSSLRKPAILKTRRFRIILLRSPIFLTEPPFLPGRQDGRATNREGGRALHSTQSRWRFRSIPGPAPSFRRPRGQARADATPAPHHPPHPPLLSSNTTAQKPPI